MFYILELKVNGVKNISQECIFKFYKKSLNKKFDSTNYNIKAIYGMSGAGKSGIIHAVSIFESVVLRRDFLNDSINKEYLKEIINKKNQELSIEMTFIEIDENNMIKGKRIIGLIIALENDEPCCRTAI